MRILLINNYDSYAHLLSYSLWRASGNKPIVIRNDSLTFEEIQALDIDCIVISPGPGHPARAADFGICQEVLKRFNKPILGVCLGHQGLGLLLGANVVHAAQVMHGKYSSIEHTHGALFTDVPSPFKAVRYHSLVIDESSLGSDAQVLARASDDGAIMAIASKSRPLYGVQFHPESIGTEYGDVILRNFMRITEEYYSQKTLAKTRPAHVAWRALPWQSPEQSYAFVRERKPYSFWLDSNLAAVGPRWSFVGGTHQAITARDAYAAWRSELNTLQLDAKSAPFPFVGGLLGCLSYDVSDSLMMVVRKFYAFDHQEQKAYACIVGENPAAAQSWLDSVERHWHKSSPLPALRISGECHPGEFWHPELQAVTRKADYLRAIAIVQQHIKDGESYEVCLTNEFRLKSPVDGFYLYRILRQTHPAPYSAFLQTPQKNVLSISPERFLTLSADGHIVSEPIKGTRARPADADQAAAARFDLQHSAKDQAELLMITDLIRNDLAKVAAHNSITVPELNKITDHATLLQLSSVIHAKLDTPYDAVALVQACFPGGSVTGAPKQRTMEIIRALERRKRGIYTGAIGYFSYSGAMDLNIAIRTIVQEGEQLSFGVGGAIVADSCAESEYEETLTKGFALGRAIYLAEHGVCGGMRVQ